MSTILDDIVAAKREEIDLAKADTPEEKLRGQLASAPVAARFSRPAFAGAAHQPDCRGEKGQSVGGSDPRRFQSRTNRADLPGAWGIVDQRAYGRAVFSKAAWRILHKFAQAVDLPVLRKDFIIDRLPGLAIPGGGADAVLLLPNALDD